jgi:hypothetical protein
MQQLPRMRRLSCTCCHRAGDSAMSEPRDAWPVRGCAYREFLGAGPSRDPVLHLFTWATRTSRYRFPRRISGRPGSWRRAAARQCPSCLPGCCGNWSSKRLDTHAPGSVALPGCVTGWISARAGTSAGAGTASMSGNRRFVDTNVLVYAYDESAGSKRDQAGALVEQLWDSREGCLSVRYCKSSS